MPMTRGDMSVPRPGWPDLLTQDRSTSRTCAARRLRVVCSERPKLKGSQIGSFSRLSYLLLPRLPVGVVVSRLGMQPRRFVRELASQGLQNVVRCVRVLQMVSLLRTREVRRCRAVVMARECCGQLTAGGAESRELVSPIRRVIPTRLSEINVVTTPHRNSLPRARRIVRRSSLRAGTKHILRIARGGSLPPRANLSAHLNWESAEGVAQFAIGPHVHPPSRTVSQLYLQHGGVADAGLPSKM